MPPVRHAPLTVLGGFAVGLLAAAPLAAQADSSVSQEWVLQGLRSAWCVDLLVDSATADRRMPREIAPVPASAFPGLGPAVTRLVEGEPEYRDWIPSQYCVLHFSAAQVGSQLLGREGGELDESQTLVYWLIAGRDRETPAAAGTWYVVEMGAGNWRHIRSAETANIQMEHQESSAGRSPETGEDVYEIKTGRKDAVIWEGRLAGDSALPAEPIRQTWIARGGRGVWFRVSFNLRAERAQPQAGTLRIVGNNDLAKALRASPIRMVGPVRWGGGGVVTFRR